MPWYSSWIPGLPNFNFAIPTSIQGRFISFVLKKTLGHLLKPGQLDYHQIDSQIGSGYVQVNTLELNPETINKYLHGLPLSLQDGTISSVKARIPWPNPLASTLGFSMKSLHLILRVTSADESKLKDEQDLANSLESVAESFIHDELSSREEATLWKSFHEELREAQPDAEVHFLPGGMDTFSTTPSTSTEVDMDPAGVSVFAGLIERLLARFEFDAQDIKITLIHPGNMSLTLSVQDIRYCTGSTDTRNASASLEASLQEGNRILTVDGITLSSRNLAFKPESMSLSDSVELPTRSASTAASRPQSPTSSTSSIGEDTHFTMSQSLAMLPPKAVSPSSSVSSSMYESAISIASSHLPVQDDIINNNDTPAHIGIAEHTSGHEDIILSISSQPLILRINIPSSSMPVPESDPFLSSLDAPPLSEDQFNIDLSIGIIACVISPWQILGLMRLIHSVLPRKEATNVPSTNKPPSNTNMPPIRANADIRTCIILLVPQPLTTHTFETTVINDFFSRPLIPPRLLSGYIRIYLDSLSLSFIPFQRVSQKETLDLESKTSTFSMTQKEFCISDISTFLFTSGSGDQASSLVAFPLLIMDHHLLSQYSLSQPHPQTSVPQPLPTFDVIDWTKEGSRNFGTRLSHWRCQPPKSNKPNRSKPHDLEEAEVSATSIPFHPALRIVSTTTNDGNPQSVPAGNALDLQVSPLHVRLDLEYMLQATSPLVFFEDLLLPEKLVGDTASVSSATTVDHYHSDSLPRKNIRKDGHNTTLDEKSENSQLNIEFHFIRLSIRCPPPTHLNNRSGTLILDFHDTNIILNAKPPARTTRFAEREHSSLHGLDVPQQNTPFEVTINRVVLACSLVNGTAATSFMSIGPLMEDISSRSTIAEKHAPALQPRISIIKPNGSPSVTVPALAVSVDIPLVYVNLKKPCFDALQYWADDINQLLERISNNETEAENGDSRDPSIIGSRFLARSKTSNGSIPASARGEGAENAIKVSITETSVTIMLPRTDSDETEIRPFTINVSDLDILIELNKQQTVLTLGIMNLVVENTSIERKLQKFFSLTTPHSLATSAKSIVKLRFLTATVPETGAKETRVKLTMHGFTYTFYPSIHWISDLAAFVKNPPGTFESVIPSDHTRISVKILNGSIHVLAPLYPGAIVSHMQEFEFSTDVVGDSRDSSFHILATCLTLLATDDIQGQDMHMESSHSQQGVLVWTAAGYALLAELHELDATIVNQLSSHPLWKVLIDRIVLRLHLCADTLTAVSAFSQAMAMLFNDPNKTSKVPSKMPSIVDVAEQSSSKESTLMSSVEDLAFKKMPEIGPAPDMIFDDLPTNLDYLDESFGAAAGLRELVDEDLDQFGADEVDIQTATDDPYIVSRIGGETIKVFDPKGLEAMEDYYLSIPPDKIQDISSLNEAALSVRILNGSFNIFLYDGYDWAKTRKNIEEEVKEMRKRLAKIRQLVANGQLQEPMIEDTSTLLYNSVHIGLDQDEDALGEPIALIAAIDDALEEDLETASQSSWQSLHPSSSNKPRIRSPRVHGKRLTRSRTPSMEFSLAGLYTEFDQFGADNPLVSRTFITVRDLEILDHIKTSTWKKFLTDLRSDSRGNVRETDSNMVRIELQGVRPVAGNSSEEVRLRAKILPLRLYVDQDAVDFLKKFFSFKDPNATPPSDTSSNEGETYIQLGEIFPIDLKLDYKPRRVDYRALKEGRTIELMNFFHFDGAEMTLRHITLAGVTGWPKFFEMLNDLWTPDVKATQLVEVISGVAPIRSVVNVGSGVADLILLPIAQYKKDGRIVRGVQKGATAFVKSTAIEAIKMGAKLATGTQVILEQAEGILGGQFNAPITAEPVQVSYGDETSFDDDDNETADLISKYAQQPSDLREGVQSAYKSLQRNINSAAQTILAVPMEVYERSGNEGPVRSVIRAVPIAVLKPMIGASEAVSKTLLGLHNTLDPNVRHDNEAKYKLR